MNMNKGLLVVLVLAAVVAVTAALCEEGEEVTYIVVLMEHVIAHIIMLLHGATFL